MARDDIDSQKVKISSPPSESSSLKQIDEVFIVLTQAFCPNGHNLIVDFAGGVYDPEYDFDGFPGLELLLQSSTESGIVVLSPFHGDQSKKGKTNWRAGTKLTITCPKCKVPLPRLASCKCEENGDLVKVFLSPALKDSHVLAICNIWGCRRSHTIDNWQIISEYLDGYIDE